MAKIPEFATEQEESDFWDTHDSVEFFDSAEETDIRFVDARPKKTAISLRLERETVSRLKEIARSKGIGYQTLIRMWLTERLNKEQA